MTGTMVLTNTSNYSQEDIVVDRAGLKYALAPGESLTVSVLKGQTYPMLVDLKMGENPQPMRSKDGTRVYPKVQTLWEDSKGVQFEFSYESPIPVEEAV